MINIHNIITNEIRGAYFKLIMLALVAPLFISCDDNILETQPLDKFSDKTVWKDAALINTYINNTYRTLPHGFQFGARRLFCLSDESKARGSSSYSVINAGNISPSNLGPLDYWTRMGSSPGYYKTITQCNIFFANIEQAEMEPELKNRMIGEMKTLRAYSYFRLITFFGGVPLITEPFSLEDDFNIARSTYDEVFDFAISELDEAIELLPLDYAGNSDEGRITKGAAMAIKARALLYAASPYNNPENDLGKWQQAADAAKAIIDLNEYSLFPDYKSMFVEAEAFNDEMIWVRTFNHVVDRETVGVELRFYPNGYNGYGQICPLQNLIEKYETLNGLLPADDPTFDSQNPYVNRDPRFYATILYDGAPFKGRAVETFLPGGKDSGEGSLSPWNASETGYYVRKYIDEEVTDPRYLNASDQPWPFARYAEVLLNYAEANYYLGNEDLCREYINKVRSRPGVAMPDVTESGDELLARLQNERFIELAFEEHRYFDVRRWMIAPNVLNVDARGISIYKDPATGVKTYTEKIVEERNFYEKNYLVPIPQSEIEKDPALTQNPGY